MPHPDPQIESAIVSATAEVRALGAGAPIQSVLLMSQGQILEAIQSIPSCPFINSSGKRMDRIKRQAITISIPAVGGAGTLATILYLLERIIK